MITVPYTKEGYLDVEAVERMTASTPFVFVIGSRQCGKTYGITRSLFAAGRRPVIVRRTKAERLKFANDQLSPISAVTKQYTGVAADDIVTLYKRDPEAPNGREEAPAGWVIDLNTASHRGFTMPEFDAVFYDECVPEQHAGGARDYQHAETFFNLLITLFANDERFLEQKEHPKVWIVGNSNSISAAIFNVFKISRTIERMLATGREVYISPQRALAIFLTEAQARAEIRSRMPLMRVAADSAVKSMALHNTFGGDVAGIRGWPLREFRALASFRGDYESFTVWLHKRSSPSLIYVTRGAFPARHQLPNSSEAFTQLGKATAFKSRREFWYLVLHANSGVNAFYDSLQSKQWFTRMRRGR